MLLQGAWARRVLLASREGSRVLNPHHKFTRLVAVYVLMLTMLCSALPNLGLWLTSGQRFHADTPIPTKVKQRCQLGVVYRLQGLSPLQLSTLHMLQGQLQDRRPRRKLLLCTTHATYIASMHVCSNPRHHFLEF